MLSILLNCLPDNPANANCLNSITSGNGKSETWLVFITHGFTGSLNDDWLRPLRESVLLRCIKSSNIMLKGHSNWLNSRYRTSNRRVIGVIVGWGAVSSKVSSKTKKWGTCVSRLLPVGNYARLVVIFLASLKGSVNLTLYCVLLI